MAITTVLVLQVSGSAWMRASDGSLTVLREGMRIPADAEVITGRGGQIQLQSDGQPPVVVGEDQALLLTTDLMNAPDASEASIQKISDASADAALAALNEGRDPFAELEATAAVLGGGGDGGSSFVRLLSVLETVSPLALEYPRGSASTDATQWTGGGAVNARPEFIGTEADLASLRRDNDDSDTIIALDIGKFFTDPEGDKLTFTATNLPKGLSINPSTGIISGTLDHSASQGGNNGLHNVTVTATDPLGASQSISFEWEVRNPPPVAENNSNTIEENAVLEVKASAGLLVNDKDPDGDPIAVTFVENAAGVRLPVGTPIAGYNQGQPAGQLTVNSDGSYTFSQGVDFDYLPLNESTTIVFNYTISDGDGGTSQAQLQITVTGTNDTPVINTNVIWDINVQEQGSNVAGDSTASGALIATDADDGARLTWSLKDGAVSENLMAMQGTYGAIVLVESNGEWSWKYTLDNSLPQTDALVQGQKEKEEFVVRVQDEHGAWVDRTIVVNVLGTNDNPVAQADTNNTLKEKGVQVGGNAAEPGVSIASGNVLLNDTDVDAEETELLKVSGAATATGQVLVIGAAFETPYGSITINANGSYTYTLDNTKPTLNALKAGQEVPQIFTYTVTDPNGGTATSTLHITITGTNDIPKIVDRTEPFDAHVTEGSSTSAGVSVVHGELTAMDVDVDATQTWSFVEWAGDEPTALTQMNGVYGSITLQTDPSGKWTWTYTLDNTRPETDALTQGQKVQEQFFVAVQDEFGAWAQKDIVIQVVGTNDNPIAFPDTNTLQEAGVQVGGNIAEPGKPIASGNVTNNDTDVDNGEKYSISVVSILDKNNNNVPVMMEYQTEYGTFFLSVNGEYVYTLDNTKLELNSLPNGVSVKEVFIYTVENDNGGTASASLTITIAGTNDQPEIIDNTSTWSKKLKEAFEGNPGVSIATGELIATDVDTGDIQAWTFKTSEPSNPAYDVLTVQGDYGSITLNENNGKWSWIYTLDNNLPSTQGLKNNDNKIEEFDVVVRDIFGAHDEIKIIVNIEGSNDVPIARPVVHVLPEDHGAIHGVLFNAEDNSYEGPLAVKEFSIAGDPVVYQPSETPVKIYGTTGLVIGELIIKENGSYQFVASNNYSGKIPLIDFTLVEKNGNGETGLEAKNNIDISYIPVSDAPEVDANPGSALEDSQEGSALIGLKLPVVTDAVDLNGSKVGDNPELLGLIEVTFNSGSLTNGSVAKLLIGESPNNYEINLAQSGQVVRILIVDGSGNAILHTAGAINEALNDTTVLQLTAAQYESLKIAPASNRHENFNLEVKVSSYEVDDAGFKLDGIAGKETVLPVNVEIFAVTDKVDLSWNDSSSVQDSLKLDINEDSYINLKDHLKASFQDLDGSERREIVIFNKSEFAIVVGSTTVLAGGSITISADGLSISNAGIPDINISGLKDFSGEIKGIEIHLNAKDYDSDSSVTTELSSDYVVLDLHVKPVVDDAILGKISIQEDMTATFLDKFGLGDFDGSESITLFVIKDLPAGWVIRDANGNSLVANSNGSYVLIDVANNVGVESTQAEFVANFGGFTIQANKQSNVDGNIKIDYTIKDVNQSTSEIVTIEKKDVSWNIEVASVAEEVSSDPNSASDKNFNNDLTMLSSQRYPESIAVNEDGDWFDLNGGGVSLTNGWKNPDNDGSEQTLAVISPVIVNNSVDSVFGSTFIYTDANGNQVGPIKYEGQSIDIPIEFLSTLKFKAPENVSGEFKIIVQAKTVDTDPDTGLKTTAISGIAELTGIRVKPEAETMDAAALATTPAQGKEDTDITLSIRPSSLDKSETFNVRIDAIPDGAVLKYNGVEISPGNYPLGTEVVSNGDGTWKVIIFDYKIDDPVSNPLKIRPPENSNEDFVLKVSAQSVDASPGFDTSFSDWSPIKDLPVSVTGVADVVNIDTHVQEVTEAFVDGAGHAVALKPSLVKIAPVDTDGSETVTFKITGVPAGFSVQGGFQIRMGDGESREWFVRNEQELHDVKIIAPPHYSGELNLIVIPITTENDGDWVESAAVPVKINIEPSPESDVLGNSVVNEDSKQLLSFGISNNHGDTNEKITKVYIGKDDIDGHGFTLFLGDKPLLEQTELIKNGFFELTEAQSKNVWAKADQAQFAHKPGEAPFSFSVKYDVTDPSSDGKLSPVTQTDAIQYQLVINPETDGLSGKLLDATNVNVSSGSFVFSGNTVSIHAVGDFDVNFNLKTADFDGSEQLIQLMVSGIPDGLVVNHLMINGGVVGSVNFVGNGNWLITVPAAQYSSLAGGDLNATVGFHAGDLLANYSGLPITISPVSKDIGALNASTTNVVWTLNSSLPGEAPPNVVHLDWTQNASFHGVEDEPFNLAQAFDVKLKVDDPSQNVQYTLKITLPKGAEIYQDGVKLTSTVIGGVEDPNAQEVWVITGTGAEAEMKALLAALQVTPAPNLNDNMGGLKFSATMTAFHPVTGSQDQKDLENEVPLRPVTDTEGIRIELNAAGAFTNPEEGSAVDIHIKIGNGVDGGSFLGDASAPPASIYVKFATSLTLPGTLTDAQGNVLQAVQVPSGNNLNLAPGEYYVVSVPHNQIAQGANDLDVLIRYEPAPGEKYTSGSLEVQAWVQKTEVGAQTGVVAFGEGQADMVGISNGFDVEVPSTITANENQGSGSSRVPVNIGGTGLLDSLDGSEEVHLILLKNLPNGFVVFVGNSASDAEMAGNAGEGPNGGAIWSLPVTNNQPPTYVAVRPPLHWSGTLEDLQISVISGEKGGASVENTISFDLVIDAQADGVKPIENTEAFGKEGEIIGLNLTVMMKDGKAVTMSDPRAQDSSTESLVLEFHGISAHAAFYVGQQLLPMVTTPGEKGVSYDAVNGTYKLTGLTQGDVDTLGLLQSKSGVGSQITFEAWTVESSNQDESGRQSGQVDMVMRAQDSFTSGADRHMFDGQSLIDGGAGEDTVWFRFGENLEFGNGADSGKFKNIDTFDLTRDGFDHVVNNLSVQDVFEMTDSRSLTILADQGDTISFQDSDSWKLDAGKSAIGDYDVYQGSNAAGQTVEVRILKGFEGLTGVDTPSVAGSRTAVFGQAPEADPELQQKLAQQVLEQGKNGVDPL